MISNGQAGRNLRHNTRMRSVVRAYAPSAHSGVEPNLRWPKRSRQLPGAQLEPNPTGWCPVSCTTLSSCLLSRLQSYHQVNCGPAYRQIRPTVHRVGTTDLDDPAVYEVVQPDSNLAGETSGHTGGCSHRSDTRPRTASYEKARPWQHESSLLCPTRAREGNSGALKPFLT